MHHPVRPWIRTAVAGLLAVVALLLSAVAVVPGAALGPAVAAAAGGADTYESENLRRSFAAAPVMAGGTNLVVTSAADAGPGTLRDALQQAKIASNGFVVTFAPGIDSIELASPLPTMETPGTVHGADDGPRVRIVGPPGAPIFRIAGAWQNSVGGLYGIIANVDLEIADGGRAVEFLSLSPARTDAPGTLPDWFSSAVVVEQYSDAAHLYVWNVRATLAGTGMFADITEPWSTLSLQYSTITGTSTHIGGAIRNDGGFVGLQGSTISSTHAQRVHVAGSFIGGEAGAILQESGGLFVDTSTIAGVATFNQDAAAVTVRGGKARLESATIARNVGDASTPSGLLVGSDATALVERTILASHFDSQPSCGGQLAAASVENLISSGCGSSGLEVAQLGLGRFGDNSGLTETIALLPGSPAVNAATCRGVPGDVLDQRGAVRTAPCDIGAFELDDPTPPVVEATLTGARVGDWYTSDVTVTWDVSDLETPIWEQTGCAETVVDADVPGLELTCTAVSVGGETTETVTIFRDATAPAIEPLDVTVDDDGSANLVTTISDVLAGVASTTVDWGDGTDPVTVEGDHVDLDHQYPGVDDYTVTVTAADSAGNTSLRQAQIRVHNVAPFIGTVDVSPAPAVAGADVTITVAFADEWADGFACTADGTVGSIAAADGGGECVSSLHFDEPGSYDVSVLVTDGYGASTGRVVRVEVVSAAEAVSALADHVSALIDDGAVDAADVAGLLDKLATVAKKLDGGGVRSAARALDAFEREVRSLHKERVLTVDQRDALLESAEVIAVAIGT